MSDRSQQARHVCRQHGRDERRRDTQLLLAYLRLMTSTFDLPPSTMTSRDDTLRDAGMEREVGREGKREGRGEKGKWQPHSSTTDTIFTPGFGHGEEFGDIIILRFFSLSLSVHEMVMSVVLTP